MNIYICTFIYFGFEKIQMETISKANINKIYTSLHMDLPRRQNAQNRE